MKRLNPEERELRRKQRSRHSFSNNAYRHYDPEKDGWGNPSEWESIAEQLFGNFDPADKPLGKFARFLKVLRLPSLPGSVFELTRAFRSAMMEAHPDHGGSDSAAREVLEAYAVLKKEVLKKAA